MELAIWSRYQEKSWRAPSKARDGFLPGSRVATTSSRKTAGEKELSFQVSCSYGPGRYDSSYEEGGNDYPLPYVRWTEKRNFEAVLNALSNGTLDVDSLITKELLTITVATNSHALISILRSGFRFESKGVGTAITIIDCSSSFGIFISILFFLFCFAYIQNFIVVHCCFCQSSK